MSQADDIINNLEDEFRNYYLIETATGKNIDEVMGTYSVPELLRLHWIIDFMNSI